MDQMLFWIVPAASVVALALAWFFYRQTMRESEGTEQMARIASFVRKGAMSYLRQQYKIVGWVFAGLVVDGVVYAADADGGGQKTASYAIRPCGLAVRLREFICPVHGHVCYSLLIFTC